MENEDFRSDYDCTATPNDYGKALRRVQYMQPGDSFSVTAEVGFLWALWSICSRSEVACGIEVARYQDRQEVRWISSAEKRGYVRVAFSYDTDLSGEMTLPSAMVFTMELVCQAVA